ncbi:hypothetical protein C7S16_1114 [Burkholderia thailandensis]|uniref:Uncharacterized protein n=1 Tax=Burkholderia thailandensis TaxID=57975 RepID=A0AAW9CXD8_BURTH|nr:hypothetical protein [Burkholderia thailandensis]MDW9255300.1 hypothetical protein [Burkholderia thailandensis]
MHSAERRHDGRAVDRIPALAAARSRRYGGVSALKDQASMSRRLRKNAAERRVKRGKATQT